MIFLPPLFAAGAFERRFRRTWIPVIAATAVSSKTTEPGSGTGVSGGGDGSHPPPGSDGGITGMPGLSVPPEIGSGGAGVPGSSVTIIGTGGVGGQQG